MAPEPKTGWANWPQGVSPGSDRGLVIPTGANALRLSVGVPHVDVLWARATSLALGGGKYDEYWPIDSFFDGSMMLVCQWHAPA